MNSTTLNTSVQPNLHQNGANIDKNFIIVALISTISSIFNGILIYLISRKKRLRPVDYLTGNLCFCTFIMCFTLLLMLSMTQLFQFSNFSHQWICSVFNYAKYFPGALVTLASFAICFERIRSLTSQNGRPLSGRTALKTILLIWVVAACFTVPALFATTNKYNSTAAVLSPLTICKRAPLFNSKYFDVLYELVKFFFFHVLFSFYLLYELYLIRSKFKYLGWGYSIPGSRLQRKIYRVRFAFVYSIILVAVWVSTGTVQLVSKVPKWFTPANSDTLTSSTSRPKTLTFMLATTSIYLLINPMAVFVANQDIKIFRKLFGSCCVNTHNTSQPQTPTCNGRTPNRDRVEASNDTDLDISRFATQQPTTFSVSQEDEDGKDEDDMGLKCLIVDKEIVVDVISNGSLVDIQQEDSIQHVNK